MAMMLDPGSGLMLPREFVDQKQALKKVIDQLVDNAVIANRGIKDTYFLILHAKFNPANGEEFQISAPVVSFKLPPFTSNQMVFWVNNQKDICELLWMVPAKKPGGKLKVEFNTQGVAYLQAKGAMPRTA